LALAALVGRCRPKTREWEPPDEQHDVAHVPSATDAEHGLARLRSSATRRARDCAPALR
jgi:hypothetical protein